jgi:pyrimidine operon attenuation protein / uracil phosphoribosyltransferase
VPHVMNREDVRRALRRIAHEILERHSGADSIVIVGIHTRGVHLAHAIAELMAEAESVFVPVGELDVGPYRDDSAIRPAPQTRDTVIPVDLTGRRVILVDDVLYTGRTVRAALDALSETGRAEETQLAVLIDRGHREIPIRPDYVGKNLPTSREERVTVRIASVDGEDGVWVERMVP